MRELHGGMLGQRLPTRLGQGVSCGSMSFVRGMWPAEVCSVTWLGLWRRNPTGSLASGRTNLRSLILSTRREIDLIGIVGRPGGVGLVATRARR